MNVLHNITGICPLAIGSTRCPVGKLVLMRGLLNPLQELALEAQEKGYACIPIQPGAKVPACRWKHFQQVPPTTEQLLMLFADARQNIALLTTGLVIFDCDEAAQVQRVLTETGDTPYRVQTPRGLHLGYQAPAEEPLQNRVSIRSLPIDLRTNGGLALLPPSRTERGTYHWLGEPLPAREALPVARVAWTREEQRRVVQQILGAYPPSVRRASAYLAKVEPAISGQRGHAQCFRAACILVQRFRLQPEQAWPLLVEWNEQNLPPFSERELQHKLAEAMKTR